MSADTPSASSGGIGFLGLLTIVLITLKLVGEQFHTPVADLSWWWVLAPLWIGTASVLAFLLIAFLTFLLIHRRS